MLFCCVYYSGCLVFCLCIYVLFALCVMVLLISLLFVGLLILGLRLVCCGVYRLFGYCFVCIGGLHVVALLIVLFTYVVYCGLLVW